MRNRFFGNQSFFKVGKVVRDHWQCIVQGPGAASAARAWAAEVEQAELAGKTGLALGCHLLP